MLYILTTIYYMYTNNNKNMYDVSHHKTIVILISLYYKHVAFYCNKSTVFHFLFVFAMPRSPWSIINNSTNLSVKVPT